MFVPDRVLIVSPASVVRGPLAVPGDKSISHRFVLFGAIASGTTRLGGLAPGADVAATCDRLMERFHLGDVHDLTVAHLPYGKRRLLEIAIAIACRPRVLLLDEPVAGVPEGDRQQILEAIGALPGDVTVLLIEHDMDLVFSFARTVSVLVNGAVLVQGPAAAIAADPRVRAVYLGEGHGQATAGVSAGSADA